MAKKKKQKLPKPRNVFAMHAAMKNASGAAGPHEVQRKPLPSIQEGLDEMEGCEEDEPAFYDFVEDGAEQQNPDEE